MAEYRYEDLPLSKAEAKEIPPAISRDLNALAGEGWTPIEMIDSRVIGKVGFLLKRD